LSNGLKRGKITRSLVNQNKLDKQSMLNITNYWLQGKKHIWKWRKKLRNSYKNNQMID